jgi:hypothetical protein
MVTALGEPNRFLSHITPGLPEALETRGEKKGFWYTVSPMITIG